MTKLESQIIDVLLDNGPCGGLYLADECGKWHHEAGPVMWDMVADGTLVFICYSEELGYFYIPNYHTKDDIESKLPDWFEGQAQSVIDMNEDTISEPQARRFWAIALDTGYNRQGAHRLLQEYGYTEAEEIYKDHYDEMCAKAEDDDLAWQMNRDPNTRDMFHS